MNESKIEELKNYVISDLNPEAIILFGSYARGTQKIDSDLDFLAIVDDNQIKNIAFVFEPLSSFRKHFRLNISHQHYVQH